MENLQKKPSKGILKSSSSFEQQNECQTQPKQEQSTDKDIKWDEMNILQTLHPADKDYGHMKIEEPKTPYNYYNDTTDGDLDLHALDADALAARFAERAAELPAVLKESDNESEEDFENLTEEEKKKRKEFEVKRKMHYNEFQAVKLARKLLEQEDDDEDDGQDRQTDADPQQSSHSADTEDTDDQRNGDHMASDDVFVDQSVSSSSGEQNDTK
ncbi:unnamed protein product [Medioppia subpectinata]|uniref:Protein phosphatase inhibitor 2 n=1 Tax=Medioppia subpectinata TaxID=1979941 RepID=A0A7R9QA77_9ACAR|nr:unnamed protein product [Medioppia subpectinata]CAG2116753.1 unnamed protein product [Medioppia subpectinata]